MRAGSRRHDQCVEASASRRAPDILCEIPVVGHKFFVPDA
jgi:hypothetical protein